MNKEIWSRIKSILSVLLFLIGASIYWYGPRKNLNAMAANINQYRLNKEIEIVTKNEITLDNKEIDFTIKNKTNQEQNYEIIILSDYQKQRLNNCKIMSNNYLEFQLKVNEKYQEKRNLSLDGIIYRGILNAKEQKDFSIKMAIEKNNSSDDECFYPILRVSSYYKL